MKEVIVTTSWDDGDPQDLRVADVLRQRGLPGTFYVPIIGYLGRRTMRQNDLRSLVEEGFEIGAHSYSHRSLHGMHTFELQNEIRKCRQLLEDSIGQDVQMFCYPNGHYDQAALDFVREAGYRGARTTRMLRCDAGDNRFEIPTTVQAFPHPLTSYVKNTAKGRNLNCLLRHSFSVFNASDWIDLGRRTFDHVLHNGGVWHLYGHSWELQDHRLWEGLSTLLDYVANREGVHYLSNGEMTECVYGDKGVQVVAA